ncbi:MAG: hypothetical protein ACFCUR_11695 [Rhodomicrobiaceae bacterium]
MDGEAIAAEFHPARIAVQHRQNLRIAQFIEHIERGFVRGGAGFAELVGSHRPVGVDAPVLPALDLLVAVDLAGHRVSVGISSLAGAAIWRGSCDGQNRTFRGRKWWPARSVRECQPIAADMLGGIGPGQILLARADDSDSLRQAMLAQTPGSTSSRCQDA